MKYEYTIEWKCDNCGAEGNLYSGVMDQKKNKTEVTNKYKNDTCPECKEKIKIKKIKQQDIDYSKKEIVKDDYL